MLRENLFCLRRSRRKHLFRNSDTLLLVVYLYNILLAQRSCVSKNNSPTRQLTDSKQNIVLRACLILHDILTSKLNLWIYVGVMECRSLFSATVALISGSGLEKMHP